MQVKIKLLVALCIFSSVSSANANTSSDWIMIASADTLKWEGRAGSWTLSKTNSGKDVAVASGRTIDSKTKEISFERWYVAVSDCRNGSGKVTTTDISGTYKYENDFVLKGGSVASSIADMLCYSILSNDAKGLAN